MPSTVGVSSSSSSGSDDSGEDSSESSKEEESEEPGAAGDAVTLAGHAEDEGEKPRSSFYGVTRCFKNPRKFIAKLYMPLPVRGNGPARIYLGTHDSAEAAAREVDRAARAHGRPEGGMNFPRLERADEEEEEAEEEVEAERAPLSLPRGVSRGVKGTEEESESDGAEEEEEEEEEHAASGEARRPWPPPGPSGYRGVYMRSAHCYLASLFLRDSERAGLLTQRMHVGSFRSAKAAARAWDRAARARGRPECTLNFPRVAGEEEAEEEEEESESDGAEEEAEDEEEPRSLAGEDADTPRGAKPTSFKGVFWRSGDGTFEARVSYDGRSLPCGRHATAKRAALSYDAKARELDFPESEMNFPREREEEAEEGEKGGAHLPPPGGGPRAGPASAASRGRARATSSMPASSSLSAAAARASLRTSPWAPSKGRRRRRARLTQRRGRAAFLNLA